MKTFKSFLLDQISEVAKPKAKGEKDFFDAHKVEITDVEKSATEGPAKVVTKDGSGKRKADKLDNKQEMGEDLNSTIFSVIRKKIEETAAASTVGGLKAGEGKIKQGSSEQSVGHSTQDPASTIGGRKGSEGKIKQGSSDENTPDTKKGEAINTIGGHKNREVKSMKQGSTDEKLPDQGGLGSREKEKNVPQGSSKEKTPNTGLSGAINTIGGHRNREVTAMLQGSSKEKLPEEVELDEAEKKLFPGTPEYKAKFGTDKEKHELKYGKSDVKKIAPYGYRDKDEKKEEFTKKQTTMAHAIGKHFAKKKVGDSEKGGPYAVATAMVRDKPDSAEKAYKTIKAKAKNEEHEMILTSLYDQLHEDNKKFFIVKLDEDYDNLIKFAMSVEVSDDN